MPEISVEKDRKGITMIKIDLITGFLGSGKTTFIKKYAKYLMAQGQRIAILENDYGAVNVDRMLLQELEGEQCDLEMVIGGDYDCHRRRMKTKLIALGMLGYDRVIIEPSGIFDVDTFFDILYEEPLDRWYQAGNVITILDAGLEENLSEQSAYLLAAQSAQAGCVIMSHVQEVTVSEAKATVDRLNHSLEAARCRRRFEIGQPGLYMKDWAGLSEEDMAQITSCGYKDWGYEKRFVDRENDYQTQYLMNSPLDFDTVVAKAKALMCGESLGKVFRIKGFHQKENGQWMQININHRSETVIPIREGQKILIVIGECLDQEGIEAEFGCR